MIEFFTLFRSVISRDDIKIDSWVSFSVYRLATIVVCFSLLLSSFKMTFTEPSSCVSGSTEFRDVIQVYCKYNNLYLLDTRGFNDALYAGIGNRETHERLPANNYTWIPFILMIQGVLLYLPRFCWKSWEGRLMSSLSQDLKNPVLEPRRAIEQRTAILQYFRTGSNRHRLYCCKYYLASVMFLIVLELQFYIMRILVADTFEEFDFSVKWMNSLLPYGIRHDSAVYNFPTVAMCDFVISGPSGSPVDYGVVCFLDINFLHEKIYIVLWQLFTWQKMAIQARIAYDAVGTLPWLRVLHLKLRSGLPITTVRRVNQSLNFGDMFVIQMLRKNIAFNHFERCMTELINGGEIV